MSEQMPEATQFDDEHDNDIAIISMIGRFPDADDVEAFWQNLRDGVESVKDIPHEELLKLGMGEFLKEHPNFTTAEASLDREAIKYFDAAFFNISPREAEIIDPQQRMFLEDCWSLFEKAGYSTEHYDGRVGVFGSSAISGYMKEQLLPNPEMIMELGSFQTSLGNDKDFLSTRVAYKMNFTGPAVNVNTLCSSAAVAIHLAREALLNYQIDFALAGAVNISPSTSAAEMMYYYEGGIGAADGHCRAYDARATGTVDGSGMGIIALKRMSDALADGDNICAVIKGTAINNDGSDKASYTAPSPQGQREVILEALAVSGVNPETIQYIDGHGTGTNIGDPIEVLALTKAYRQHTDKKQYCGIGSVKTNIGHLVTAGGVASLIKTVLGLQHQQMPPSLNFDTPNPKIDFANSPFYVNHQLQDWPRLDQPRRAAVSSFGIGGTNVHIILEEAPQRQPSTPSNQPKLIQLSAKSANALGNMKRNLAEHLRKHPKLSLDDVAYTLQVGRCSFEHKFVAVCEDIPSLIEQLGDTPAAMTHYGAQKSIDRKVCLMFSGQGSQYQQMAKGLYDNEAVYREAVERCAEIVRAQSQLDIVALMYPSSDVTPCPLEQTQNAQLSLFISEYALWQQWQSWGIEADAFIGHSIGELVAACGAGVFSLEDALLLVTKRGEFMAAQQKGAMLSVGLSEQQVVEYLSDEVALAAVNGKSACVLSGSVDAIESIAAGLADKQQPCTLLKTSHAFHSHMMDGAIAPFVDVLKQITLSAPSKPFISNVSGQWITPEQATSADYWAQHLRGTVRFYQGLETLAEDEDFVLLEAGPGASLTTLAKMTDIDASRIVQSLPRYQQRGSEQATMKLALGQLWCAGVKPDWQTHYSANRPNRVELPTYAFERQRFWLETRKTLNSNANADVILDNEAQLAQTELEQGVSEGRIELNLKWADVPAEQQKQQLQAVLALKQQLEDICSGLSIDNQLELSVSGLKLLKRQLNQAESKAQGQSEPSVKVVNNNQRPDIATPYVPPSTELEKALVETWENALGFKPVGINDNFFDLGGHSLIAATLVNHLRQNFEVEIDLRELLESPTVATVAELVQTKQWLNEDSEQAEQEEDGEALLL